MLTWGLAGPRHPLQELHQCDRGDLPTVPTEAAPVPFYMKVLHAEATSEAGPSPPPIFTVSCGLAQKQCAQMPHDPTAAAPTQ